MEILSRRQAIKKGLTSYFTNRKCKKGHLSLRNVWGHCHECVKLKNGIYKRRQIEKDPLRFMLYDAKRRSKELNLEFSIKSTDLETPKFCPLLGIELIYGGHDSRDTRSASIDRINNKKGYYKDNVWIISDRANRIKRDASFEEFEKIYKNWQSKVNPGA